MEPEAAVPVAEGAAAAAVAPAAAPEELPATLDAAVPSVEEVPVTKAPPAEEGAPEEPAAAEEAAAAPADDAAAADVAAEEAAPVAAASAPAPPAPPALEGSVQIDLDADLSKRVRKVRGTRKGRSLVSFVNMQRGTRPFETKQPFPPTSFPLSLDTLPFLALLHVFLSTSLPN
jgi:hypothetical protein